MKKFLFSTILYSLFILSVFAQAEADPEDTYRDADYFYDTGEYEEALYLFRQLGKDYPENANLQFRIGMSYLNIPGSETQAIPHLEKAVQNTTLKYKEADFDEKEAPHHALFYLGKAYRINNQLDDALETYEKFMDIRNFEKKYNLRITENEIKSCQRAKIIQDSPIELTKRNPGQTINNSAHNFHPVVTPDENAMVYMQRLKFYDAIMYSYKKEGEWSEPINITPQVGSDGEMIPSGISPDGTELLLVKKEAFDNGDIYYSKLEGNFWSKAVPLSKKINTIRDEDHASFSPDGKTLLFSSNRRGGYGKLDIYRSERLENGEWSEPENLGPTINTPENETSAFFMMNNHHLYFASNGHFNMGGYDIFFSEKENNEWTDPVNLGYPLNTTGDNRYYQPVKKGNTGYLSLFDQEENINKEDIYRIEMAPPASIPLPRTHMKSKSFILEIEDPGTGEVIVVSYDKEKDTFRVDSEKNLNYKIRVLEK
ncbi:MAG: tetratricopeptide repeat protein [Bacteroidota bacterium]